MSGFGDPRTDAAWNPYGITGGELPRYEMKWKLAESASTPVKAHTDDAGFDLFTSRDVTILPGQFYDVPTGVFAEPPPGVWGMLAPRSSTLRTWGLRGVVGIIDSGYRGELFCAIEHAYLRGQEAPIFVPAGTRLFQYIPMNNAGLNMGARVVTELSVTPRGHGGFGSSGR